MTPASRRDLVELLAPYREPGFGAHEDSGDGWRFADAAPAVARAALGHVDAAGPPGQPPQAWLVDRAVELDGRLGGFVDPSRGLLRLDTLGVHGQHAGAVVAAADRLEPQVLRGAVAEAWRDWSSRRAFWTGRGSDELPDLAPSDVVTFWWGSLSNLGL